MSVRIQVPFHPLPKARDWLTWRGPSDQRGPFTEALLGGWGSGKTSHAAVKFLIRCLQAKPGGNASIIAPTSRVLQKAIIPKLNDVIPSQLVRSRRGRPHPEWTLVNGVTIAFVSGDAMFEGEDQFLIWVDEVHKMAGDDTRWTNYMARLRQKGQPTLSMIATGLPEAGWVREHFDVGRFEPGDRPFRNTTIIGTRDNPHLPPALVRQIMAACPSGYEESLLAGGWMPMADALYSMFNTELHVVPDSEEDRSIPLSMGMDIGVSSGAVTGYRRGLKHGKGVLITKDYVGDRESVRSLATRVRDDNPGRWVPGHSKICVDPTIRADELEAIYKVFPGLEVVIRKRTDPFYATTPGIRMVQAALLNMHQQVSWHVCNRCRGTKRGIIDALLGTKKDTATGHRKKGNTLDHVEDGNRYLVNELLGDQGFDPSIS